MGLPKLGEVIKESRIAVGARFDQLDMDLRSIVELAGNTLASCIG